MNTIFFKTFLAFLTALTIFMLIMVVVIITGYNISYHNWVNERLAVFNTNLSVVVKTVLTQHMDLIKTDLPLFRNILYANLPQNIIFTFYDREKNPILTFEKIGRARAMQNRPQMKKTTVLYPVIIDTDQIFYYSFLLLNIGDDQSTEKLINSMGGTLVVSFFISFLLASLFAIIYSRHIAVESNAIASGINLIAHGNLDLIINEKGTKEIALIAASANLLREKLKKEKALRDQWALDIAHDLRTPIAALRAQMEGMKDKVLDLTEARFDKNLAELSKIENLINDLKELIILESPEIRLKNTSFNLAEMIGELIAVNEYLIREKNLTVDYQREDIFLSADKTLIMRALGNVIHNAFIYVNHNGTVKIEIQQQAEKIVIDIFNSGSFIPENEITKIFDRLYRGDNSRNTKGTGLGLSISKKIIELHQGEIRIQSEKEKGTVFSFIFKNEIVA